MRQTILIEMNLAWLRQAQEVLNSVTSLQYTTVPNQMVPHKLGSQMRHILEFYECFLDGAPAGRINYDARLRDMTVETSRNAAIAKTSCVIERLSAFPGREMPLLVHAEDAEGLGLEDPYLPSSTVRELMTLSGHTIHHFAIVALALRAHDVTVPPDLGVAPSTLRYRANNSAQSPAAGPATFQQPEGPRGWSSVLRVSLKSEAM